MNNSWLRATLPIALLFMFRMLGLFMLIPIFSIFAVHYIDASPLLIGFAMGAYGLTQGLLQLPMGLISDKIGRKPVLILGFALFLFGSLLGVYAKSIYTLIAARGLQGLGAVGSVLIASLADRVDESHRAKSMAIIGISIAVSFALAMVMGPFLASAGSLSLLFWIMVAMSVSALVMISAMPFPATPSLKTKNYLNMLKIVLSEKSLLIFDMGIFCQHAILTSTFFALPLVLVHSFHLSQESIGSLFYLPIMLIAFLCMFPIVALAERTQRGTMVLKVAVILTFTMQLLFSHATENWWAFGTVATLYFLFFNILEATLPAIVSTKAPVALRGTAMGVYSSCQFLGIFAGGLMSGLAYQTGGVQGVFICNSILTLIWVLANAIL